tara:strand:+ start:401 stop:1138 length:738 start_codon:yes stop_codon:yes gene_type:complete
MNPFILALIGMFIFYVLMYAMGCLVYYNNVKVNYTRKIGHFSIFFIPIFSEYFFLDGGNGVTSFPFFLSILIVIHPRVRNKFSFFQRTFLALDRPEDRPYTVRWFYTQAFTSVITIMLLVALANQLGVDWLGMNLLLIPLTAIGDGLAEPIGVRFGTHRYKSFSLFPIIKNKYYRTLEGSVTVYLSSLLILLLYQNFFTTSQFINALIILPILVTLTEAVSPHTQDSAFLNLSAGIGILFIKLFA